VTTPPSEGAAGIQAAIDSLPNSGGKVVLQRGTYELEETVEADEHVYIEGAGMNATVLKPTDDFGPAVTASGTEEETTQMGFGIEDLTIQNSQSGDCWEQRSSIGKEREVMDGYSGGGDTARNEECGKTAITTHPLLHVTDVWKPQIHNIRFHGGDRCIRLDGYTYEADIRNCRLQNFLSVGIDDNIDGGGSWIYNCDFNGIGDPSTAISAKGSNLFVIGSWFETVNPNGGVFVDCIDGTGASIVGNAFGRLGGREGIQVRVRELGGHGTIAFNSFSPLCTDCIRLAGSNFHKVIGNEIPTPNRYSLVNESNTTVAVTGNTFIYAPYTNNEGISIGNGEKIIHDPGGETMNVSNNVFWTNQEEGTIPTIDRARVANGNYFDGLGGVEAAVANGNYLRLDDDMAAGITARVANGNYVSGARVGVRQRGNGVAMGNVLEQCGLGARVGGLGLGNYTVDCESAVETARNDARTDYTVTNSGGGGQSARRIGATDGSVAESVTEERIRRIAREEIGRA
jgi:hypothetical protein